MDFNNEQEFQDHVLKQMNKYPETNSERIIKSLITSITIITLAVLLFVWDESNKEYEIKMKTTKEVKYTLMSKKAYGKKTWVKISEHERINGGL